MKITFIKIVLLMGFAWNGLFGVSDGILLHMYGCVDECQEECGCPLDGSCEVELEDNYCYSVDMHLKAEQLDEVRIDNTGFFTVSDVEFTLVGYLFDKTVGADSLYSTNQVRGMHAPPLPDADSINVLKTIVLRV